MNATIGQTNSAEGVALCGATAYGKLDSCCPGAFVSPGAAFPAAFQLFSRSFEPRRPNARLTSVPGDVENAGMRALTFLGRGRREPLSWGVQAPAER
jgi:hypothetical protein